MTSKPHSAQWCDLPPGDFHLCHFFETPKAGEFAERLLNLQLTLLATMNEEGDSPEKACIIANIMRSSEWNASTASPPPPMPVPAVLPQSESPPRGPSPFQPPTPQVLFVVLTLPPPSPENFPKTSTPYFSKILKSHCERADLVLNTGSYWLFGVITHGTAGLATASNSGPSEPSQQPVPESAHSCRDSNAFPLILSATNEPVDSKTATQELLVELATGPEPQVLSTKLPHAQCGRLHGASLTAFCPLQVHPPPPPHSPPAAAAAVSADEPPLDAAAAAAPPVEVQPPDTNPSSVSQLSCKLSSGV
ncbi:unnamed protein product [Mesocestoides corti]|uniref:Uncharacterized protein n=1 Tax=Mesocestoides corti TaxID=53468 RepID=A0A0R3UAM5_MESCO|nr:unnamed protein product [Mesocestoides corti]